MKTLTIIAMTIFLFGGPSSGGQSPIDRITGPSPTPLCDFNLQTAQPASLADECKAQCPLYDIVPNIRTVTGCVIHGPKDPRLILLDQLSYEEKRTRELFCSARFGWSDIRRQVERFDYC